MLLYTSVADPDLRHLGGPKDFLKLQVIATIWPHDLRPIRMVHENVG